MNASSPAAPLGPRWKSYCFAFSLALPAAVVWQVACVWVFPKLQEVWRDSGVADADKGAQHVMDVAGFLVRQGGWLLGSVVLALALFEWQARRWPRSRWLALGTAVWVINFAVIVGLMCMCMAALLAAPALAHRK